MPDRFVRDDRSVGVPSRFLTMFEAVSPVQRAVLVWHGLHAAPGCGLRKQADEELRHLVSWVAAFCVPVLLLLVVSLLARRSPLIEPLRSVRLDFPKLAERKLDPLPEQAPTHSGLFNPALFSGTVTLPVQNDPLVSASVRELIGVKRQSTPPGAGNRSLVSIPLPIMTGGLGRRRETVAAIEQGPAEDAVLRALRWLKQEQQPDGSWQAPGPAMTGLALLCFLGHGETPAESAEFGECVRRGIEWLLANQGDDGRFLGSDGHEYSLPIAAYALSEAAGMMGGPGIRAAARKSIRTIVNGQNASGGWNYNCRPSDRNDTSYMGWCIQALKAAEIAGVGEDSLPTSMRQAAAGIKLNAHPEGGFGYVGPGKGVLTGVGILGLQMLEQEHSSELKRAMPSLAAQRCDWDGFTGPRPLYYWYYNAQASFHAKGRIWTAWEKAMVRTLVHNQTRTEVETEVRGHGETGYWDSPSQAENHGRIYSTALCTLMLEVYYRYLPTYRITLAGEHDPLSGAWRDAAPVVIAFPDRQDG